ncbi:MAG TPA: ABC transporter ATP-binding protein [Gaiellaceae bacterium]
MADVRWDGAEKRYGDVRALDDLRLEAADGEFLVLVGPSGSGKTTALRLVAGLEALTGGHVWIGGRQVDRLPPRQRGIAMVFQDYALYPQMSVEKNLAFGLRIAGVPRGEIRERIGTTAEMLGLADLLGRKPRELSGGQRQRVALGRALVRGAGVLLMDEPLSNLDAQLRAQTRIEIKRLHEQAPTTTVYVTHDQVEAMTMGDRVAVMQGGKLQQVADPATIYDDPANVFVASFIGTPAMALNRLGAAWGDGGAELGANGFTLRVPAAPEALPADVTVGLRPEHCRLWRDGDGLLGPFEGRVESFEALGRESFIGVEVADGVRLVVAAEGTMRSRLGELVRFGIVPGRLHLFSAESGLALGRA